MYLWLAIDVNGQLRQLRDEAEQCAKRLHSQNPALTLPLHVSLRISFFLDDTVWEAAVRRIERYYATLRPFSMEAQGIEKYGEVVWLKITENPALSKIHQELVALLFKEYGVLPHAFDKAFLYHASLFMDPDPARLDAAYALLRKMPYPEHLTADRLLIGCSQTGRAGEYRVLGEYLLS